MDKASRNAVVAAMVVAAFGLGTQIGRDATVAEVFGAVYVFLTVFILMFLTVYALMDGK